MSQGYKFTNMDDIQTYEQLKHKHADYFKNFNDESPVSIASKINKQLLQISKNGVLSKNDNFNFIYRTKLIHVELGDVLLSEYRNGRFSSKEEINDGSILFWAIYELKDFDFIKSILEKSVDVNKITYDPENNYRSTPLFQAIHERQFDIVELLLITGEIDINLKPHGETVLMFTLKILFDHCVYEVAYHKIIKLLLQHADINVHEETREGESALDLTIKNENEVAGYPEINREIFESLITHKNFQLSFLPSTLNKILEQPDFDKNLINIFLKCYPDQKRNALIFSIRLGHLEAFILLLETAYAEQDYDEIVGKTPLYLAIESDSFTIFDFLIKKQKTTIDLDSEFLPLKKIIELYGEDMSYLKLFLQYHSDKIYKDALMDAVHYDNIEALTLLLKVTDINHEDENGITVLIRSTVYNNIEMTKILLSDEKIIVDFVNKQGLTALHFAIYYNNLEIVKLLTSKFGIDLNAGIVSPLVLAVIKHRTEIVQKLVEFGNLETWATQPEFKAIAHTSLLANKDMQASLSNLLMQKIFGFFIPPSSTSESKTDLTLKFNGYFGLEMVYVPKGSTALSIAVTNGNIEIVKLLLHAQEWDQVVLDSLLKLVEPEVIKNKINFITIKELLNNKLKFLEIRKKKSDLVNYGSTPHGFVNNDPKEYPGPKRRQ